MVSAARKRAQRDGIPFDLRFTDFVIPVTCPITQRPFAIASGSPGDDSPTLDKIIPERGYVRGNIAVISHRANRIKSDADLPTIQRLLRWLTDSVHIKAILPTTGDEIEPQSNVNGGAKRND